jgi:hypothetical protein
MKTVLVYSILVLVYSFWCTRQYIVLYLLKSIWCTVPGVYSIWYSVWCDVYLFFRPALQICTRSLATYVHSCSTDVHFEESNLDIKCCLLLLTGEI